MKDWLVSISTNDWIEIISALGQIGIAASVAYIAWRSYALNKAGFYVNKDQLRLALFDRRFKIYEGFRVLLMYFIVHAKADKTEVATFMRTTIDAEFLFGKDIEEYRQIIFTKCLRLQEIQLKFEGGLLNADERKKFAEEAAEIEQWLSDQWNKLGGVFRKYLHFSIDAHPHKKF